eukprot:TRINITY_DN13931_c0_g1_i1.p1 TRINITY_DN13931_c0_g1~~TRINITY_DN13931_c0_g1_i1.p1  ORF type:complete len:798 (+),score=185.39 TRINITY_DN13931_c0_g1_i1:40-2433(+)
MSLFRSSTMSKVQLYLQNVVAETCVENFGFEGLIQFNDLNSHRNPFEKRYTGNIQKCDDSLRRLRFIESMINKHVNEETLKHVDDRILEENNFDFDTECRNLIELEQSTQQSEDSFNMAEKELESKYELSGLLKNLSFLMADDPSNVVDNAVEAKYIEDHNSPLLLTEKSGSKVGFGIRSINGIVSATKLTSLRRAVYRISRGTAIFRSKQLDHTFLTDHLDRGVIRHAFIIILTSSYNHSKLQAFCETIGCGLYHFEDFDVFELEREIKELEELVHTTESSQKSFLVKQYLRIESLRAFFIRRQKLFICLNMFRIDGEILIGEGWIPADDIHKLRNIVDNASAHHHSDIPSFIEVVNAKPKEIIPTHFHTNVFTSVFVEMISSYGVARVGEINPAFFATVSFPFLFGVMYGDVFHGCIFALLGLLIILLEKKIPNKVKKDELFSYIYDGRYIIFMMGLWSIYIGFLYNDIASLSFDFPSNWKIEHEHFIPANNGITPFGIDPAIRRSQYDTIFANSLKMKTSIIFGVSQMFLGLFLSLANLIREGKISNIFLVFIPQFILLFGTFGWLVLLIFVKWCTHIDVSLLQILMDFIMEQGSLKDSPEFFPGHQAIQTCLFYLVLISVFVLFLGEPLYHTFVHSKPKKPENVVENVSQDFIELSHFSNDMQRKAEVLGMASPEKSIEKEEESIWMSAVIEAIEFTLACLSHTASYLRLWALSLAHSQLSDVSWMLIGLGIGNPIMLVVSFFIFASLATCGVLVAMEGLGAFLHALRLHWVEFMSKFYKGDGTPFLPLKFEK